MAVRINRNNYVEDYIDWDNSDSNSSYYPKYLCLLGSAFEAWEVTSPIPSRLFRGSYGFNNTLMSSSGYSELVSSNRLGINIYSINRGRSNIPTLLDSGGPWGQMDEFRGPPITGNPIGGGTGFFYSRHNGYINGLFLDWSVRKVGLKELYTLKWHKDFNTAGPWTKAGGVKPNDWPKWIRNFKDY